MATVALGIGSNIDAENNIIGALNALKSRFGCFRLSSVYESRAVGFNGDNFLNLVVVLSTDMPLPELVAWLKALEDSHGRDRSKSKFSGRQLDIDVLLVDDLSGCIEGITLPRGEITENAFVLQPLAEVLPDFPHPLTGETFSELWMDYDRSRQKLWKVAFPWNNA